MLHIKPVLSQEQRIFDTENICDCIKITMIGIPFIGYKGWGCTDSTDATSEIDLLAATLLLCLSNLLFLPAVGLAIYRGFYTESFIYFANMVFSTVRSLLLINFINIKKKIIFFYIFLHPKSHIAPCSSSSMHVTKTCSPFAWWSTACCNFATTTRPPCPTG